MTKTSQILSNQQTKNNEWAKFLSQLITKNKLTKNDWKKYYRNREKLDISDYK